MPIYEYRCPDCGRKVSLFFRTVSAATAGAATAACPHCQGQRLQRLVSRVSYIRAGNLGDNPNVGGVTTAEDLQDEDAYGSYDSDPDGFKQMLDGVDENDPRSVARWARDMQRQTGEDLGPEFDSALTRIESGEDPDRVMDEMEPAMSGDAESADSDFE
jgi:putative FmdB family regulatory protein